MLRNCFLAMAVGCLLPALAAGEPYAAVQVLNRGTLPLVETDSVQQWRYIPDFIRGSSVHSLPLISFPADSPANGMADWTVTESGKMWIAANYDYQGNSGGGWLEEQTTRDELEAQGWLYRGDMRHGSGGLFRLFEKQVTAGEQYHLRVGKYTPPWAITGTALTGTLPSAATPWPEYGQVAVADFNPVPLDASHTNFAVIPESLQGGTIFSEIRRPSGAITDFKALADGRVYLAGYWGYDGNSEGDWDDYRLSLPQMEAEGWTHFEQMTDKDGRVWDVIYKDLQAGQTYSLRFNKYSSPLVVLAPVPEPGTLALAGVGACGVVLTMRRKTRPLANRRQALSRNCS
jgi:hypothetical protein